MNAALRVFCLALLLACTAAASAVDAAESTAKRKVIIDQDAYGPAGSNLQAILMLLQSPNVEVLGITVVSGDGWVAEEVDQTLRLLEIAGRTEVPVYAGAVYPLINTPQRTRLWERLYGKLFYKGAWTDVWPDQGVARRTPHVENPLLVPPSPAGSPKIAAASQPAAQFLTEQVRRYPGAVTLIAAGPLTNLALAARLDPTFAANARELVFMGGSYSPVAADNAFAPEYANVPRREFNFRQDPEAASIVLHETWRRITQVPVDPTTKTFFKPEFFVAIGKSHAPFAAYLLKYGQPYPMWDELAVAVWLDPSLVTRSAQLFVDVDTSFTASYGNTLSFSATENPGLGERQVQVVQDIDLPRFEHLTLDLLSRSNRP